jgi:16S rRNA (uracil1498-N3)-methyltransferase
LQLELLSNIELYYSPPDNFQSENILLTEEDFYHAVKVMRHRENDIIYVTNGEGKIFKCKANKILKNEIYLSEIEHYYFKNELKNIFFCIPKLKNVDRLEFAIEKCVELGVTNFIIFTAERSVAKGGKLERWEKIAISAMKQSLRSFVPQIKLANSLKEIVKLEGKKFVFEQNSNNFFDKIKVDNLSKNYLIFGPEGGLSQNELTEFNSEDVFQLNSNRLRTETAVIFTASLLN